MAEVVRLDEKEKATDEDDVTWPIVFKLKKPIEIFGTAYTELKLRRPNVGDGMKFGLIDGSIADLDKGGERTVELISVLAGETPQTIKSLPLDEFMRLTRAFWDSFQRAAR